MDRGASMTEYAAVIFLVAAISTAVFTAGIGTRVTDLIQGALCSIQGDQECSAPAAAPSEDPEPATPPAQQPPESESRDVVPDQPQAGDGVLDNTTHAAVVPAAHDGAAEATQECEPDGPDSDHDRRDAGRDTANTDDRDTSRRTDANDSSSGTCGTPAPSDIGLGSPEPGESVDVPEPPPWEPVDEGAGEWGLEDDSLNVARQRAVRLAAEAGAHSVAESMPNASRNLLHYLGNSGDPLEQDVDQIFEDVPEFADQVDSHSERLAQYAVDAAREADIDGPTTFPINTPWAGFYIDQSMSSDWFRALGGIQYNITGHVTVYPPNDPDGEYRYEMETATNIRDQYNWDAGKAANVGPFTIEDETMGDMHRAGIAQEYTAHGRSETQAREGTIE